MRYHTTVELQLGLDASDVQEITEKLSNRAYVVGLTVELEAEDDYALGRLVALLEDELELPGGGMCRVEIPRPEPVGPSFERDDLIPPAGGSASAAEEPGSWEKFLNSTPSAHAILAQRFSGERGPAAQKHAVIALVSEAKMNLPDAIADVAAFFDVKPGTVQRSYYARVR
jgi:hypothetical protein